MGRSNGGNCGCIIALVIIAVIGDWLNKVMDSDSHFGAKYGSAGEMTYWEVVAILAIVIIVLFFLIYKK